MQREPAVSVLVPCYDKAPFVEETLQSVYAQSFGDWELIVVDDGSRDGTADILRKHEGRARVVYQTNQGASAARQRALREARGRYVQYLDADDVLLPHALADRVAALERSGADVAYSDWQRLRPTAAGSFAPAETVARRMQDVHPDPEIACFTNFWSPPAALLYSSRIVERIGPWNPMLPVIQDARYLLDAALLGARFVHVPGVSALYREDVAASLSRRSSHAFTADVVRNADQIRAIWQASGPLSPARKTALAECYGYVARVTFRHDDAVFDYCLERLSELNARRMTSWPVVAAMLRRSVGKRAALAILGRLRRPAS